MQDEFENEHQEIDINSENSNSVSMNGLGVSNDANDRNLDYTCEMRSLLSQETHRSDDAYDEREQSGARSQKQKPGDRVETFHELAPFKF